MKSKIASQLDLEAVRNLIVVLLAAGTPREQVIREVAAFVDDLVDWREVVKGLGGQVLEAVDGALALAIVSAIATAIPARAG